MSILDILGQSPNNSLAPAGGSAGALSGAPTSAPVPSAVSPFASSLMASDAPGIFGILGRMSGNPTSQEYEMQRLGSQQAAGLAGLQKRITGGMNPQQAIVDFVSSPEGQKFFGSSQDPIGAIKGYLQISRMPLPKFGTVGNQIYNENTGELGGVGATSLSPGEKLIDGKGNTLGQNDPLDVQTFKDTTDLAKLTPDQTQEMAKALLKKQTNIPATDAQLKADGVNWLLSQKMITPEWAQKYQAGLIQVQPTYDATHSPNGVAIVDLSKMATTGNPADARVVIAGSQNGGISGNMSAGQTFDPTTNKAAPVSGDIIFGAGPVGNLAATVGGAAGNINPKLAAPQYAGYQSALATIMADVTNVMNTGKALAQEMKFYTNMADKSGLFSNPMEQGTALLQLHDVVDRRIAYYNTVLASSGPQYTNEVKGDAAKNLAGLQMLQADLPPRDSINEAITRFQNGEGGLQQGLQEAGKHVGQVVQGVTDTLKSATGAAGDAATATEKAVGIDPASSGGNAPQSFKTEQDAAAAANSGTLTPDASGKIHVIINGVERTLSRKGGQ